jgi:KaiC/GvpD/RAD55 family RecA-like ATPase
VYVELAKLIKTGIEGLDEMLNGGLIPHRPYIISGPPGSGKTLLCLQFLYQGLLEGEKVLFVTLDEPPNEIKANIKQFEWDAEGIDILDANSDIRRLEPTPIVDITSRTNVLPLRDVPSEIRKTPEFESVIVTVHSLQQALKNELDKVHYERIAIDSITGLKYFCMEGIDEYSAIQSFLRFLAELKVTTFLTVETPSVITLSPEMFLARGEFRLHMWREKGELKRGITIEIYKGSKHDESMQPLEITSSGIVIGKVMRKPRKKKEKIMAPEAVEEVVGVPEEPKLLDEFARVVASIEGVINDCKDAGIKVDDIEKQLVSAKKFVEKGEYKKGLALVTNAETTIDARIAEFNVRSILNSVQSVMADCKEVGIKLDDIEELIVKAERYLKMGSYSDAMTVARECESLIDNRISAYNEPVEKGVDASRVAEREERIGTPKHIEMPAIKEIGQVPDESVKICTTCGKKLVFITQYTRWYCYYCKKYAPK